MTRVCCQGCGADLDVDESVRFVTCNYCQARLEIVHDPTVTHTRLFEKLERNTEALAANLRVIELQNDLERLDREWADRREGFMVTSKNGRRSLPSHGGSLAGGVFGGLIGLVMLTAGLSNSQAFLLTPLGILFVIVGIAGGVSGTSKANAYQAAAAAYEGKRRAFLQMIHEARRR